MKRYSLLYSFIFCLTGIHLKAQVLASDSLVLVALYNSTNGPGWTSKDNWLTGPVNTWFGITVSGNRINSVNLPGNLLQGNLPSQIGDLENLVILRLESNSITGNIPTELGNLTALQSLAIFSNLLTGTIPPSLGNLTNLLGLYLYENQLTGSIPVELGNLINLRNLDLYNNQLSGSIPKELGNLSNLQGLALFSNQLTGSLPVELGNLNNLGYLGLWYNQLSGSIPKEFGNLTNLELLSLHSNALTGSIPEELGNLSSLVYLDLQVNQLTGSIPTQLGSLINLQRLYLGDNDLSGSIPKELGNLLNLNTLSLHSNQLTGSVPSEIGNLSNLIDMNININQLFDLPDLKALPLINLSVGDNYFQFDDIQLNLGITGLYYLFQKPIQGGGNVSLLARQTFVASFSVGGNSNVYQWRKNGVNVVGANTNTVSISSVSLSDEGSYELMVTNPQVPNLTLLSEPIVLSVSAALIEVKIDNFVKLDEDQVEFKTIGIGSSNIKDLIITNRGNTQLVVSNIEITGDFSFANPLPSTINPGESELLSIRFAPTNLGGRTGTITIYSNADVQVYTLNLVGEGDAEPEVYNVVTVNENSKHDFLNIRNITLFPKNRVSIYDRWGNMVFEKDNYDNVNTTFTGTTDSGKELAEGTYYYVIDKNNGSQRITGFLLLKR